MEETVSCVLSRLNRFDLLQTALRGAEFKRLRGTGAAASFASRCRGNRFRADDDLRRQQDVHSCKRPRLRKGNILPVDVNTTCKGGATVSERVEREN
ncbi:hypothetical protein MATL_G00090980 [Megalops atlanticus]|uniref:Uncharacterized protein n=1 Tax=Megalops atlanticus TaxID=7932 RepID=A0A9D3TFT6_MEGAT|nr:hypothetical protein MATL_G00090980 [Megalops atlanticus]